MNDLENLQAPHNFGVCASACCTKRFDLPALYSLAECFPAISVPATLTPRKLESMKGKCEYYRPEYAGALCPRLHPGGRVAHGSVAGTFRLRLISYFGRKNYYLARKGRVPY